MTITLYVDPARGSDYYRGASWSDPLATIQKAIDVAERGAKIVLALVSHDVGPGAVCEDNQKALTIRGANPLMSRGHADRSFPQAHIRSTAKVKPSALIRVGNDTSGHVYGWTFGQIYFDADSLAPGGACLETHGVNKPLIYDIAARAMDSTGPTRHLIHSDAGAGDDASWWHLENVHTTNLALADSYAGNYWTFDSVTVHGVSGGTSPGPALHLRGSQHNLSGLNFECWDTAVRATGCRGLMGHGVMSESVRTLVHMVGCSDSIIAVNSSAGYGASNVVDEDGTNNTVIGADHHKTGSTSGAVTLSEYGTTYTQTAGGSANLLHGPHPTRPSPGVELLPEGMYDIAAAGTLSAEYWDGHQWRGWGVDTRVLPVANLQAITVDAAHKRVRFRTRNLSRAVKGLGVVHTKQAHGTDTKYTFRILNWSGTQVLEERSVTTTSPGQTMGATVSLSAYGAMFEFEADFGITGDQAATISRLHLFTPAPDPDMPGKDLRGPAAPEGVIHGAPGDTYTCTAEDVGLWVHTGPAGVIGWRKLAYAL